MTSYHGWNSSSENCTSLLNITIYIFTSTNNVNIGRLARMWILDTEVDGSNPGSSMLFP